MKKLILPFIILIAVVQLMLFTSCQKSLQTGNLDGDYFPLQVGNYWEFNFIGTKTIDEIVTLDGKEYFRMVSAYSTFRDTTYYRKTSDGKVYSRKLKTAEGLMYDFRAEVKDSWKNGDMTITLNKIDGEKDLGTLKLKNCYVFYQDPKLSWADDEYIWWFAPGIGFVYYYALGGVYNQNYILKKSRINGVETTYE
jgi:hypothetical protein